VALLLLLFTLTILAIHGLGFVSDDFFLLVGNLKLSLTESGDVGSPEACWECATSGRIGGWQLCRARGAAVAGMADQGLARLDPGRGLAGCHNSANRSFRRHD
jgi:hypothetical protein